LFGIENHVFYLIDHDHYRYLSLNSTMNIPFNVEIVQFTWIDDTAKFSYQYNTSTTNVNSLLSPVLNIENNGSVPKQLSNFSILFPCVPTAKVDSFVNCSVLFHFYKPNHNSSSSFINLKFRKQCLKGQYLKINESTLTLFYNADLTNSFFIQKSQLQSLTSKDLMTVLTYSMMVAFIVFMIVFSSAMILVCLYRNTVKRRRKKYSLMQKPESTNNNHHDTDGTPFQHQQLPMTFDPSTNFRGYEDTSVYSSTQYDTQFRSIADETTTQSPTLLNNII